MEKALSTNHPVAYGIGTVPEVSLAKSIGQPHDANYALLYALYKLNTDVSGCVHKWAGGVTGAGWRIITMDPDATLTPALENQMQEIEQWLPREQWFVLKAKRPGVSARELANRYGLEELRDYVARSRRDIDQFRVDRQQRQVASG